MTSAALPFWARLAAPAANHPAQARTAPSPRKAHGPVFIHDAVTPYRGETMLSAMLRADLERALKDDQA